MGSTDWKTWALVLTIVLGASFEALKHLPLGRHLLLGYKVPAGHDESYNVRGQRRMNQKPETLPTRPSSPMRNSLAVRPKSEAPVLQTTAGKGAELPALVQIVEKGKKKKKKKKKAEAVATTTTSDIESPRETVKPDREDPPAAVSGRRSSSETVTYATAAAPAKSLEPATAEEWFKILKEKTDKGTLNRFIQAYKERSITAAVFYKVVGQMLEEKNEAVQINAVTALSATTSLASFVILADISREFRTDSNVRIKAEAAMNRYANISTLSILQTVMLASDNPYTTLMATKQLDGAITRYSQSSTPEPGAQSTSRYARYFEPFVSILKGLSSSPDTSVASQASQTLASLQSLLGGGAPNSSMGNGTDSPEGGSQAAL